MERMMERTAYSKMENEGDRKTERPVERSNKRRFGKRMAGMLKTGLLFLPVLCLEGCAEAIPAGLGDSSLDGLSERSSCFTYYASACDDGDFQVKGRVYLHETNAGIVCITAEEDTEVDVQGSIKNAEGDVQLVFEAQDKTRTVIVDGENREVEEKVAVAEGKSEIYFTGEGSCEFKLEMTAGDKVSFDDGFVRYELGQNQEDSRHHHHHAICLRCGRVISFEGDLLETLEQALYDTLGFRVTDHEVKLTGYCRECGIALEKERQSE